MDPSDMTDLSARRFDPQTEANRQNIETLRSAINVLGQRVYDLEERSNGVNVQLHINRQASDYLEASRRQMDEQFAALAIANVRLKRKLRKQARELMALNDTVTNVDAHLTAHTEASAEAGHGDLRG